MSTFELNRGLAKLVNPQTFQFATWDIEASEWWNLVLIGMWDGERYVHFQSVPEFIRFLLQKRYNHWRFFAHFGGRYDINFIFDWLRTQEDIDVHFYCSGAMVIRMTLRYKGITVYLCDSYRLFYMPGNTNQLHTDNKSGLRQLGIAFNVDHKKSEIDFRNISYNRECIEYNEQDCRCLYEVIERFFEETGVFSETYASHALKLWRKDFLRETIWKPCGTVLDFVRKSYCAGRVEIFKREASHCYAYDVNSMYPFVMQFGMPTEYLGESRQLCDRHFGFLEAEVSVPEVYTPCLPVPREKLYFPVGTLRWIWTSEELIEAERRGAKIQKIHHGFYFKTSTIFKEYVEKLYALKKRSGEPTRTIAKGLLNALYGKFGQNPTKKVYCSERTSPNGATPILHPDGVPSGFAYFERTSRASYLLPHISAAITSKARLHLLGNLCESSYYCDTDSVFTTFPISTSDNLGEWAFVGEGEVVFIQPKLYKWKGTWKSKGLNREQSIDDFISGNRNTMQRVRSIKEALKTGNSACAHILIEKFMRDSRPKRAWCEDGQETRPWNMKELET